MYRKLGGVIWPPPPPLSRFCFAFFSAPPRRTFFFIVSASTATVFLPLSCILLSVPHHGEAVLCARYAADKRSLARRRSVSPSSSPHLIPHAAIDRAHASAESKNIYIYIFVVVLNCALLSGQIGATRSGGAGRNDRVASCHCPVEARSLFCL